MNNSLQKSFFILFLFLLNLTIYAQSSIDTLKGTVTSFNSKEPIYNASLVAFSKTDSSLLSYAFSDLDGIFYLVFDAEEFSIKNIYIEINHLLHEKSIVENFSLSQELSIELIEKEFSFKEIEIKAIPSIKKTDNKIIYDPKRFIDSTETVVAEMLAKLPGVDVENDGTVIVHGKPIDRILLDGDDLTERNYQVISNHFRSEYIDKVEILYNYSDNPIFSDLYNSNKIALNLKIKEENKKKLNIGGELGYGVGRKIETNSLSRYELGVNVFGLYNQIKLLSIPQFNNIGKPIQETGITRNNAEYSNNLSVINNTHNNVNNFNFSPLAIDLTRHNRSHLFSNKLIFNLSNNWKFTLSSDDISENFSSFFNSTYSYQTTNLNRDTFKILNNTNLSNHLYKLKVRGNLNLKTQLNVCVSSLTLEEKGQIKENDFNRDYKVNPLKRQHFLNANFIRKLSSNFVNILYFSWEKVKETNQTEFFYTNLIENIFTNNSYFDNTNNIEFNSNIFKFSNRLLIKTKNNPMHVDLFYLNKNNIYSDIQKYDFDNFDNKKNIFQSEFSTSISYQIPIQKFSIKLLGQASWNNVEILEESSYVIQTGFMFNPIFNINISKKWKKTDEFNINYNFNAESPNVTSYLNFGRVISRFQVIKGVEEVFTNKINNLQIEYTKSINYPFFLFYVKANYLDYNKGFLNSYFVSDNITFIEPLIRKNSYKSAHFTVGTEKFISVINSTIKIKTRFSFDKNQDLVNQDLRDITSENYYIDFSLRSGFDFPVNFNIGFNNNINHTKIQQQYLNFNDKTALFYCDLDFRFKDIFKIKSGNSFFFYTNRNNSNSKYNVSELSLIFLKRWKKIKFQIDVNNLFNETEIVRFINTNLLQISNTTKILPRYFILRTDFSF